jgi:hypothetical protein
MDVVRHEDIANDVEMVFPAGVFEDLLEDVAGGGSSENVGVTVATDGDEMKVSSLLATDETRWHCCKFRGKGSSYAR